MTLDNLNYVYTYPDTIYSFEKRVLTRNLKGLDPFILESSIFSHANVSPFIPIFHRGLHIVREEGSESLAMYNKIDFSIIRPEDRQVTYNNYRLLHTCVYTRSYVTVIEQLKSTGFLFEAKFTVAGENLIVRGGRDILWDEQGNVLFGVGVTSADFEGYVKGEKRLDLSNTVLFKSRDFVSNPKYSNLRKRLEPYFQEFVELGIDEITTNRIEEWLYGKETPVPNFKNIIERKKYFSDLSESFF